MGEIKDVAILALATSLLSPGPPATRKPRRVRTPCYCTTSYQHQDHTSQAVAIRFVDNILYTTCRGEASLAIAALCHVIRIVLIS